MKLFGLLTLSILPVLAWAQTMGDTNYQGSQPSERHVVNQTQALTIVQAAAAHSAQIGIPVNIAVCDPYGYLQAFLRVDNAFLGSIEISQKKAKTVALFGGSVTTAGWYNITQPGASLYAIEETNGGLIVFGGGIPIFLNGFFIGAIGVSGGTTDQDVEIATAGLNALSGATTISP